MATEIIENKKNLSRCIFTRIPKAEREEEGEERGGHDLSRQKKCLLICRFHNESASIQKPKDVQVGPRACLCFTQLLQAAQQKITSSSCKVCLP